MSRIRTIKPEFFRHEALFEAEKETGMPLRVAFAGLWTAADREGRFKWRPRQLKLDVLPFDEVDFERVLDELASRGFIVKYSAGNVALGCIPSWKSHQVINNRESASALPAPSDDACLTREPRVPDASATREPRHQHATSTPLEHAQAEGEGEGKEEEKSSASSSSAVPTGGQPLQVAPCHEPHRLSWRPVGVSQTDVAC